MNRVDDYLHGLPATAKRALLARLLRQEQADEGAPLSFAQQELWRASPFPPADPSNHIHVVVQILGTIQRDALLGGLAEVARRHASLRTVFREREGGPRQQTLASLPLPARIVDLSQTVPAALAARLAEVSREEVGRPFDLAAGPLWRVALAQLARDQHRMFLTMHHAISDGWSVSVLLHELWASYQATVAGQPCPLPPLAAQYGDYCAGQRDALRGDTLDRLVGYWRERLSDLPPALRWPDGSPPINAVGAQRKTYGWEPSAAVAAALREVARRAGCTLFMTLLATFAVALWRLTGQHDLLISTPVAARRQAEFRGLIGCFSHLVPLRVQLADGLRWRDLLAQMRTAIAADLDHQDLPLVRLLDEARLWPHAQRLLQLRCALQNYPFLVPDRLQPQLSFLEEDSGTSRFDLAWEAFAREGQLRLVLKYRPEVLGEHVVRLLADDLNRLLASLARDPEAFIVAAAD